MGDAFWDEIRNITAQLVERCAPERIIRFEAEDAGHKPGDESLPSRWLGWRSQIGFLIC